MSYRSVNGINTLVHVTKEGDNYRIRFEPKKDDVRLTELLISKQLFSNIVKAVDAIEGAGKVEQDRGE